MTHESEHGEHSERLTSPIGEELGASSSTLVGGDPAAGDSRHASPPDFRLESRIGHVTLTLLDGSVTGVGVPVLQLSVEPSLAVASRSGPAGGLLLLCRMQLALHHYARERASKQASKQAARQWEPVLASCNLGLTVDVASQRVELSSFGPIELDVSTRLLGSLLRLQRLDAPGAAGGSLGGGGGGSSGSAGGADGGGVAAAARDAPFVLRNETGTPMCFWIDGPDPQKPLTEIPPGGAAHLPESPSQLSHTGRRVHLIFHGFQQLDMRADLPPYLRRCRLWPAGESPGSAAIINVLLESREEHGTETCTLHSRFLLQNATGCALGRPTCACSSHAPYSLLTRSFHAHS